MQAQGYAVHVTDQALKEMVKRYQDDHGHTVEMHANELTMGDSEPPCSIGTDNLFISHGVVQLCPYHAAIGNLVTGGMETLKQMWNSETAHGVRRKTRACRRLCTISCLRRTPLRHKVATFLRIA